MASNNKSSKIVLNELCQKSKESTLIYHTRTLSDPKDSNIILFQNIVEIMKRIYFGDCCNSKKTAESNAASKALLGVAVDDIDLENVVTLISQLKKVVELVSSIKI